MSLDPVSKRTQQSPNIAPALLDQIGALLRIAAEIVELARLTRGLVERVQLRERPVLG
jgi:hypothetical protein